VEAFHFRASQLIAGVVQRPALIFSVANQLSVLKPGCSYMLQLHRLCQNGSTFHGCTTVQTFKEAESSVL